MPLKRIRIAVLARLFWLRRRAFARGSEISLLFLALLVGVAAGCAVSLVSLLAHLLHSVLFLVPFASGLSGSSGIPDWRLVAIPVLGGVLTALLIRLRRRKGSIVDPIEANALYGGRMSLGDGVWVILQNLCSNGFGLSVGLEAAYTQISSGIASKIGYSLKLRREDMRVLVGCGAAGAIAAAFGAPLSGAFYAFELIIGSYSSASLAPVIGAAIVAMLVSRALSGQPFAIEVEPIGAITGMDFPPAIALGASCALLGILVMVSVVRIERLAKASGLPVGMRPAMGGLLVGTIAIFSPQIMSSGHGAMQLNLISGVSWQALLALFALKAVGSALSIGTGFRGGLFFASLLMGALIGKAAAYPLDWLLDDGPSATALAVIGMSAFGTAVVGGPLTMTFMAIELTGELPVAALVLAACITSSLITRQTFGYSFATWRFHLRGETIRSAHDVGWIRHLTVDRLMRRDVKNTCAAITPDEFRSRFPLGSTQRVIVTDRDGRYLAMVLVPEVHADRASPEPKSDLADFFRQVSDILLPGMNARQAAAIFDASKTEALAVVSDRVERRVIGILTEAHTLRRYSEELDKQQRTLTGAKG